MLLLAASIAGGTPVNLNDTLPGIDRRNASLVVSAVAHARGPSRPRPDRPAQASRRSRSRHPARKTNGHTDGEPSSHLQPERGNRSNRSDNDGA
jgi:hypothetical protein